MNDTHPIGGFRLQPMAVVERTPIKFSRGRIKFSAQLNSQPPQIHH